MPFYIYINNETGEELEVLHSSKELEEGISEYTKKKENLPHNFNQLYTRKIEFEAPTLHGFDNLGRSTGGGHRFTPTDLSKSS